MHISLTTRANVVLAMLWAWILAVMLFMNWPQPVTPVALAFVLGSAAGILQTFAMKKAARQFVEAASPRQMRAVLASTEPGKAAIALVWMTAIGMLAWSLVLSPDNPFILWIPAYAAFALARELFAMPAVIRLNKKA